MERTLTYTSSNGKQRVWTIVTKPVNDDIAHLVTTHGELDGVMQTKTRVIKGKNKGRANATTALEQAEKEAESKYKLKMSQVAPERPKPMLAHVYKGTHISFPCFVQPKLNGVRGVYEPPSNAADVGHIYSRLGNDFEHLDHILEELKEIDIPLDGELYSPDISFEALVGVVKTKKAYDPAILQVKFYVFDCMIPNLTFEERLSMLRVLPNMHSVVMVPTTCCGAAEYIPGLLEEELARGYEGIMLRNINGPYVSKRSQDLQKVKKFLDDEFEIVGYERVNNSPDIVWKCITRQGHVFAAKQMGGAEERCVPDDEARAAIGQKLTVKYQEITNKGLPRFPVALGIRCYE